MTKWLWPLVVLFVLASAGLISPAEGRGIYRRYLDPAHAEEILAGLSDRPRLLDDQWSKLLGPKRNESYKVVSGDSLWTISKKILGDAFLWRKLWEENPFLTNPHDISSGTVLNYYKSDRDLASDNTIRIPLIRLRPPGRGQVSDIENDTIVAVNIKNRFHPNFFVLAPEDKFLGEISGSYTEREGLGPHESVFIKPENREEFKVGQKYTVIHVDRALRDRTQLGAPILGTLVRYIGEVKVMEMGERLVRVEVTSMVHLVKRGDKIIVLQKPSGLSDAKNPPNEIQTRIVQGEEPETKMFGQGQIVLLNKGKTDGVDLGYVFRVFRETDLKTEKISDVEPESKGEVQIIHSSPLSSIGYILRSTEPLIIGDTLIPRQAFLDPEAPPHSSVGNTEID